MSRPPAKTVARARVAIDLRRSALATTASTRLPLDNTQGGNDGALGILRARTRGSWCFCYSPALVALPADRLKRGHCKGLERSKNRRAHPSDDLRGCPRCRGHTRMAITRFWQRNTRLRSEGTPGRDTACLSRRFEDSEPAAFANACWGRRPRV